MANFQGAEYKTLEQCYPLLVSLLQQSPNDLATQLIPSGMLSPADRSFLGSSYHDVDEKARRIVDAVMIQVANDSQSPNLFEEFLLTLGAAGPWTKSAVEKLQLTYSELKRPTVSIEDTDPREEFYRDENKLRKIQSNFEKVVAKVFILLVAQYHHDELSNLFRKLISVSADYTTDEISNSVIPDEMFQLAKKKVRKGNDLQGMLKGYFSWYNFELIEFFVTDLKDYKLTLELDAYKKELKEFSRSHKFPIFPNKFGAQREEMCVSCVFKIDKEWKLNYYVELRIIKQIICDISKLKNFAVYLRSATTRGCVELTFDIPYYENFTFPSNAHLSKLKEFGIQCIHVMEQGKQVEVNEKIMSTPLERIHSLLLTKPFTTEELCIPSVEKVWYHMGVWLGLNEETLQQIKENQQVTFCYKIKKVFDCYHSSLFTPTVVSKSSTIVSHDYHSQVRKFITNGSVLTLIVIKEICMLFLQFGGPTEGILSVTEMQLQRETKIISALCKVGLKKMAGQIKGKDLLNNYLEFADPASNLPEYVCMYANYLKSKYEEMNILPNDWPPKDSSEEHYTKLALITNDQNSKSVSSMQHDYAHGEVDNIVASKHSIELEEVFYPQVNRHTKENRLTILVDGAPGVGKTTMTRKLCVDWARGEMLQEYDLVILIPVRLVNLDERCDVNHLFPSDERQDLAKKTSSYYTEGINLGKRILFIFDGYDEAHESCKTERSLLSRVIFKSTLHNSSVLITSRPYASGYLKINLVKDRRHVEVLGFSKEQIKMCIQQNIPSSYPANKLLTLLKDRLDIVSLCYIPLNCKIVLFVYKHLNFELPKTLTKLYEIFILHTIKHHAEKIESSFELKEEIHCAEDLSELSPALLEDFNVLCQLAFRGIEQGKFSFDHRELKSKSLLLLGLMNCFKFITPVNVKKHFQFLHLTIQEFLAAKHLASLADHKLIDLVDTKIHDIKFRMTLLFLAGITELNFVPSGQPLVNIAISQITDVSRKKLIVLLAQLVYESQKSSGLELIPLKSNKLDLSGFSLSPFEYLVIVHFLASTPKDYRWKEINFVNCEFPQNIFNEKHKQNSDLFSAGMTEVLYIGPIDVTYMYPVVEQGLHELHLFSVDFSHNTFCELCKVITSSTCHPLETVSVKTQYHYSELSRNCIRISKNIPLCSSSFTTLLHFLRVEKSVSIICPYHNIFAGCLSCRYHGRKVVKNIHIKMTELKKIEVLSVLDCNYFVLSTLLQDSVSLPDEVMVEVNNDLSSLECLSSLLIRGITLKYPRGYHFRPNGKELVLTDGCSTFDDFKCLVETFYIPVCFVSAKIYMDKSDMGFISLFLLQWLHKLLQRSSSLQNIEFYCLSMNKEDAGLDRIEDPKKSKRIYVSPSACNHMDTRIFALLVASHKSLQSLKLDTQLEIRRNYLFIAGGARHDFFTTMCTNSLKTLFDFLTEPVQSLTIKDLPDIAFQDCFDCKTTANVTVQKLLEVISRSNQLKHLEISRCKLSEKFTSDLVKFIPKSVSTLIIH